jgi:hypothetical protein
VLEQVLAQVDERARLNLKEESEEERMKLADFLSVIQFSYRDLQEFSEKVFQKQKPAIQSLVFYLVKNFEEVKKRAYLGFFLAQIFIPDEYLLDPSIQEVQKQQEELKQIFI